MKRVATGLTIALVLACLALPDRGFGGALPDGKPGVGDPAPSFTATDLEGKPASVDEILKAGKVVLLNFWGMRCANCVTEIGFLNPIYDRYAGDGAVFLGVNVDGAPAEMISRSMARLPNVPRYRIIPDPDFRIPDLYNMAGAPLSIIIGRDGKIAYRHEDFQEGDEKAIEKALADALAATAGAR